METIEDILAYLEDLIQECHQDTQVAALSAITIRNGQTDSEAPLRYQEGIDRLSTLEEIYHYIRERSAL